MTQSEADRVLALVCGLWSFASRWSEERSINFTDALKRIDLEEQQWANCLRQMARESDKTPGPAALLKRLSSLVGPPTNDGCTQWRREERPEPPVGQGFSLHDWIRMTREDDGEALLRYFSPEEAARIRRQVGAVSTMLKNPGAKHKPTFRQGASA